MNADLVGIMPRVFEIVQHTADIRILVTANTVEELFRDALLGLMHVIHPGVPAAAQREETIEIESPDLTALLIDFLNDALLRCHLRRQRYVDVQFASLSETAVAATLTAVAAGESHEDVKAVTYHEADVRRRADGQWHTAIVLDI